MQKLACFYGRKTEFPKVAGLAVSIKLVSSPDAAVAGVRGGVGVEYGSCGLANAEVGVFLSLPRPADRD